MAFDPEVHEFHPETGFIVHKDSGHPVGLHSAPIRRVSDETEWPKWVTPHENHVVLFGGGQIATPRFVHHHVNRVNNAVTVMVHTPEEEAFALADPLASEAA